MKLFSKSTTLSLIIIAGLCTPSVHGRWHLPSLQTAISAFTPTRAFTPGSFISGLIALAYGFDDRVTEGYAGYNYHRVQGTLVNAAIGLMLDRLCSGQITQSLSGREVAKEYAILAVFDWLGYCAGKYVPMAYHIWRKKSQDFPTLPTYLRWVLGFKQKDAARTRNRNQHDS